MAIAAHKERVRESIHSGKGESLSPAPGLELREFVTNACGARGFSTGTATFAPGAVLAYHTHTFSETITLLSGVARVIVEGRSYQLNQFDCIHVPAGVAHDTARGPIINQQALIHALQEGRIRGAGLDVFESEPLPGDSPLLKLENVILTSHSIAWTQELFRDMGRTDCEGALAVQRGEKPPYVVNQDVLERPGFLRKLESHRSAFAGRNA